MLETEYPPTRADRRSATPHPVPAARRETCTLPAVYCAAPAASSDTPARPVLRDGRPAKPVTVAVLASDPVTGQGAAAYLGGCREVKVLAAHRRSAAEVILLLVGRITGETLDWMQRTADASTAENARFVLVGDGLRQEHLLRAVSHGMVSVVPRQEADFDRILRAVCALRDGRPQPPDFALSRIVDQVRKIQQEILEPRQLTWAGLESREVDVLRLLGAGRDTAEIARELSYSERTVKNIIHGVLTRMNLRNRTHAVAYALRNGVL